MSATPASITCAELEAAVAGHCRHPHHSREVHRMADRPTGWHRDPNEAETYAIFAEHDDEVAARKRVGICGTCFATCSADAATMCAPEWFCEGDDLWEGEE